MEGFVGPGQTLAGGKYRVERILGQGGMGVVVSALHVPLGQHVALKFLQPAMAANPGATQRFLREARAAAQIQSEHVARVMDVGTLDFGAPYMVMELLRGSDLARWLREKGPLTVEQAVSYVLQACEAIAEAHSLGIVHRDVKPANLFLTQRADGSPLVKVLDFGISKAAVCDTDEFQVSVTSTNAVMGSPRYMAPEQLKNAKDVDARADIWSLGIVLYELIAGVPPYPGETPWDLMSAIISDEIPALRTVRPDAPALVDRVISRCLEKDRERRFSNLAELVVALKDAAPPEARVSIDRTVRIIRGNQQGLTSPGEAARAEGASPATFTASAWDSHPARHLPLRRNIGIGVASVAGVALLGVGAFALWGHSETPDHPSTVHALSSGSISSEVGSLRARPREAASETGSGLGVPRVEPEPTSAETAASSQASEVKTSAPSGAAGATAGAAASGEPKGTQASQASAKAQPRPAKPAVASPAPTVAKPVSTAGTPAVKSRPSLTDLMQSRKPGHGKSP
ncbi:MAG TPA: serine/threonine-protein kinase [Polyangiaceae bacterium]|nr:serine/threonine-protein kinase [Polyangiaceae bacterium]